MNKLLHILLILFTGYYSQIDICFAQRWEIIHGLPNRDEDIMDFAEYYDYGYMVAGHLVNEQTNVWNIWNIKTDINGNKLWDKIFQYSNAYYAVTTLATDSKGETIIAGNLYPDELRSCPLIIKYDSCGNEVWCHYYFTDQFIGGVFLDIIILNNDDILALARFGSQEQIEQIFLFYFDENGNLLWNKSYATKNDYPEIAFAIGTKLYQFQDHYMISGYCYWPYPSYPELVWMHPLFIYIDSSFNEQWILPYGVSDSLVGKALGALQLTGSEFMGYGKCYPDAKSRISTNALIARFNISGEETQHVIIESNEINPPTNFNVIQGAISLNDTLFIASANFGPANEGNPNGEYIFNLNGHIFQYQSHPNTWGTSKVIKTSDNKFVFGTTIDEPGNPQYSDILLYKLNANLEQDTVYTGNYTYDSLCPHQIQSGIIDISDCDMTVNIKEIPSPKEYYASLKTIPVTVFPNPGKEMITLQFENTQYHTNILLQCFDLLGRKIHEEKVYPYQGVSIIDVSYWNDGMYMAVVTGNGKVVGRCKFVVRR